MDSTAHSKNILRKKGSDREDVTLILQWVMFASRPLTCQELYNAVRTGQVSLAVFPVQDGCPSHGAMAKFILHASKGLVELTQGQAPVVQFVHESVRGFLRGTEGFTKLQPQHSVNFVGSSHELLKSCCQTYISADLAKRDALSVAN